MGETTPTPWAKVRAAMLGVVVLVHGVRAAPFPHVVRPSELKDPVAQEEVARWTERLGSLGYVISEQELGERVVWITGIIGGAHQASTAPFRPLFKWTGTNQGWALFANPDTHPSRLRVDGLTDQGRVVLYLADDPEHAWLARAIEHRRVRPLHDAKGARRRPTGSYRRFVDWVWARAQVDHPELKGIEVVLLETYVTFPGEAARRPKKRHGVKAPR